ncbi:PREDICTED: uncharacterized protein LOC109158872 [Ipomoea nil]|uniref:uncharacterized protein LOC109158872 n=1 Tax=Ipomoea nil TaxID=35883 RepID=UPI000901AB70|nr:PREDICTED: uncharacterized protein LOC109158872 [Ipomoea nil]
MGILNVEDEHQATALTLSPCSKSCVVEIYQKGSDHGYEEAPAEGNRTKKTVRFEEGCNQIVVFTSAAAAAPHASKKKVVCICAPATHAGAFKCRLHRENTSHRFHGHRPSSSAPWMVKHGGRGSSKVSQHGGGFGNQTHHSRLVRAAMANVHQEN